MLKVGRFYYLNYTFYKEVFVNGATAVGRRQELFVLKYAWVVLWISGSHPHATCSIQLRFIFEGIYESARNESPIFS